MKILFETTSIQTYKFVPREYVSSVDYTLTNEETNTSVTKTNLDSFVDGGYLFIDDVFDLKEGVFYNIEFIYNNKVIYRGRILCSNQDIDKFTMNKDQYTEDTTYDNEYAIYGQ